MSDGEVSRFVEGWGNRESQLLIPLRQRTVKPVSLPSSFCINSLTC